MTQPSTDTAVRFFIAVPGDLKSSGIYGVGNTPEAAVEDAWQGTGGQRPFVDEVAPDAFDVINAAGEEVSQYVDRADAEAHLAQLDYRAVESTELLHRHVEEHGCDAAHPGFSWERNGAGLMDLVVDERDELDEAVDEVEAGLEGVDDGARAEWTAKGALEDAEGYVAAYVCDNEGSAFSLLASRGSPFHTALVLRIRDSLLEAIAERDAA